MDILFQNRLYICLCLILMMAGGSAYSQSSQTGSEHLILQYNRPINADQYLIRPGEILRVTFLGTQLSGLSLGVDAEGRIVNREIGLHVVSGLSLTQARAELEPALANMYPNAKIELSIGAPRLVSIDISGWVENPGTYAGFTSQTVSEIIDSAGGLAQRASHRAIKFIGGPKPLTVDLEKAAFLDDYESNPNLYAGISIIVPEKSKSVVGVVGQVRTPKEIEFIEGDSLGSLIALAGGITADADLASAYVLGDSLRDIRVAGNIHSGDIIIVPPKTPIEQIILIVGAVVRPGAIPFKKGMTLDNLLVSSGGPNAEANSARITIFRRAEVSLMTPHSTERYPISSSGSADLVLKSDDSVFVPLQVGFVRVSGRVERPGLYPYSQGKPVSHYIEAAGGIASGLKNSKQQSFELLLFDRVSGITFVTADGSIALDGDEIIVSVSNREN